MSLLLWKQCSKSELIDIVDLLKWNYSIGDDAINTWIQRRFSKKRLAALREAAGTLNDIPSKSSKKELEKKEKEPKKTEKKEKKSSYWESLYKDEVKSSADSESEAESDNVIEWDGDTSSSESEEEEPSVKEFKMPKSRPRRLNPKRNDWGRFEETTTGLLIDKKTNKVYGVQASDGSVVEPNSKHLKFCKLTGLEYDEKLFNKYS